MAAQTDTRLQIVLDAQDNASKRIADLEKQLSKLERTGNRAASSTSRSFGKMFGGREAGVSGRFARMLDSGALNRESAALAGVNRNAGDAANSVARLLPRLAGIGAVGMVAGIDRMAASWADATTTIGRQARMLGMPVAHLDALGGAAELAGSSADALKGGLAGLQQGMYDARFGKNPGIANLFQALHVGLDAKPEEAFRRIIQAAHDAAGPLQRMTILTAAFGSEAANLYPVAEKGLAALDRQTEAAKRFGVQSEKNVARAGEMKESWAELGIAGQHLNDSVMSALSPTLTMLNHEMAQGIRDVSAGLDKWSQAHGPEDLSTKVKKTVDDIEGMAKDHPYLAAMLGIAGARALPGLLGLGLRMVPGLGLVATGVEAANLAVGDVPTDDKHRSEYGAVGKFFYDNNPAIRWADSFIRRQNDQFRITRSRADSILQLKALGWTESGAIGSAANAQLESRFDPRAHNDENGGHTGLFQWDASRKARIEGQFHKRLEDMSVSEQVGAYDWEMRKYYPKAFANANAPDNTPGMSGGAISRDFEVPNPADPGPEMLRRGALADAIAKQFYPNPTAALRQAGGSVASQFHLGVDPNAPNPYAYGPYQETTEEPDLSRGMRPEQPDLTLGGLRLDPTAQSGGTVTTNTNIAITHEGPPRVTSTVATTGNVQASKPKVAQSGMARGT